MEAKSYKTILEQRQRPFCGASGPIICSYQFAKAKADDIEAVSWDLVVMDEAHRLRNVYKTSNAIAKTIKEALLHVHSKVLLTATPLQNSLLELYGLVSIVDDRVFGDIDSFRAQFTGQGREQALGSLRERLLQKFDSDTERRFAILLERDVLKWFKPVKGQFQIYYKLGTERPEYIPDFVAETDSVILMIETKARVDLDAREVQAKAAAGSHWCRHASSHAREIGAKPWMYLLMPHDEVTESKRIVDYLRCEWKAG